MKFWHNCCGWPELTDWLLDCDGTNWIFNLKTGDEHDHLTVESAIYELKSKIKIARFGFYLSQVLNLAYVERGGVIQMSTILQKHM